MPELLMVENLNPAKTHPCYLTCYSVTSCHSTRMEGYVASMIHLWFILRSWSLMCPMVPYCTASVESNCG